MNNNIFIRVKNRIIRLIQFLNFKLKNPGVKIINPNKIGTYYSQDGQDFYLSSLLFNYIENNPNPWMVDVGCNHPKNFSNSLFFEKWMGFKVLAIDPLDSFFEAWSSGRPSAIFECGAISSTLSSVKLRIPKGGAPENMFSTIEGGISKLQDLEFDEREVRCFKLSALFNKHQIKDVLIMSIDVEGVELDVLRSIHFEAVSIKCILVENNSTNPYGSSNIRTFLRSKNFIFHARIGFLDDIYIHQTMFNGFDFNMINHCL
ncbi:FkbM family methyltransferase [Polynucleobacter paneuropaeus]|nr:FkbM family methyltransferase [Polynucleobacter paneuropaeus]